MIVIILGQKLLRKADFHLGQAINSFFRIRCKLSEFGEDKKQYLGVDKRHITMFGKIFLPSVSSNF